jgi:hypothetical protein
MPRPRNSTTPNPLLEKRRGLSGCFLGVASGKPYPFRSYKQTDRVAALFFYAKDHDEQYQ